MGLHFHLYGHLPHLQDMVPTTHTLQALDRREMGWHDLGPPLSSALPSSQDVLSPCITVMEAALQWFVDLLDSSMNPRLGTTD